MATSVQSEIANRKSEIPREDHSHEDGTVVLLAKGVLIGIANIIPGVSGGTFALVLGLYDRLIRALRAVGLRTVRAVAKAFARGLDGAARADLVEEAARIDLWFLVRIGVGAAAAVLGGSFLIEGLLVKHPGPTLSFFLGLIIPSLAVPWALMGHRRASVVLWMVPGAAVTVGVAVALREHAATSDSIALAFLAGVVAICAMVLPGISGSFVLLVIGQYQHVLEKLQSVQRGLAHARIEWYAFFWLSAMAVGCVVGLVCFARLLDLLLKRYRNATMAFLIGLIIGSFWVLWPFKDLAEAGASGKVKIQVATAVNRAPKSGREAAACGGAFAVGLVAALGVSALGRKGRGEAPQPEDEPGESRAASPQDDARSGPGRASEHRE